MQREEVDALLSAMLQSAEGISDLLFVVGKPPQVEAHGKLKPVEMEFPDSVLTPDHTEKLTRHLMAGNERLLAEYNALGSCDCSYAVPNFARFRVNIYRQNGNHTLVMRKLPTQIPSLEKLGLSPLFKEIIKEHTGVIFVTGATGSGKTTTLAAMLNELNQSEEIHIVTLEDPIEFLHPHLKATFSQRELGRDFHDFASGLRAALRQAPKAILVGEIRDRETMQTALTAAETGHVVFSTLHTINAGQTINRIIGMFNKEEETQVRQRLADTLRYVISQKLVSKIGGGRLLITEIMGSSLRTREAISLGESELRNLHEIIEAGQTNGWHSFEQSLLHAYEKDLITEDTAILCCTNKNKMRQDLDIANKRRNPQLAPSGLKMTGTSFLRKNLSRAEKPQSSIYNVAAKKAAS